MRNLHAAVQSQADPSDVRPGVPARAQPAGAKGALLGVVRRAPVGGDCAGDSAQAPPRWEISDHAVYRYRQRCPGKRAVSLAQAVSELTELSARAHFVKRLQGNLELWRGGLPWRLRYRVERDGVNLRLVTVLRGCDTMPHGKRNQR